MAEESTNRVIVATQFSKLRRSGSRDVSPPDLNLYHESLAALAEALDVLALSLYALPDGRQVDPARLRRLAERASLVEEKVAQAIARGAVPAHHGKAAASNSNVPFAEMPEAEPASNNHPTMSVTEVE